jgi:hypothetical protein
MIPIDFCDFRPRFPKTDNFFYNLLKTRFPVEVTDLPKFLFYCDPNQHVHRIANCIKIFVCVEWWPPDWSECDYALTTNHIDDPRHLRLPFYVPWGHAPERVLNCRKSPEAALAEKTGFCSFVVSANHPIKNRKRWQFYQKLSRYKPVASGGRYRNNVGGPIPYKDGAKVEFLSRYKFHLAFENESHEGYTSEKIVDAMVAESMPVYWGNPRVGEEFNSKSFLNYFDYANDEELIERIIELDKDDAKYLEVMRQPCFLNNTPNEFYDKERLLSFFDRVFSAPITPVSRRRRWFQFNRWMLARKNRPH